MASTAVGRGTTPRHRLSSSAAGPCRIPGLRARTPQSRGFTSGQVLDKHEQTRSIAMQMRAAEETLTHSIPWRGGPIPAGPPPCPFCARYAVVSG